YVLLVALFFGGGYAVGRMGTQSAEIPVPENTPAAVETVTDSIAQSPVYQVIIENGILKIYKCIGENKMVITSEEISESVFPKSDIEELREVVEFDRLEQAQQMVENFVS
ncbi:MAG: hypothetical protein LIO53_05260, partial [Oscillospiraceae bacterium]|nr:hypothetical protein [Oscillospiraceae bacterium]